VVRFTLLMEWTTWTGSPTGSLQVANLPYTSLATSNILNICAVYANNIVLPASSNGIFAYVMNGAKTINIMVNRDSGTATNVLASSNAGSTDRFVAISGTYEI
jgi:hypothetical protein